MLPWDSSQQHWRGTRQTSERSQHTLRKGANDALYVGWGRRCMYIHVLCCIHARVMLYTLSTMVMQAVTIVRYQDTFIVSAPWRLVANGNHYSKC